jgi:hypothetical protein
MDERFLSGELSILIRAVWGGTAQAGWAAHESDEQRVFSSW